MLQINNNIIQEGQEYWTAILDDNFEFNSKERLVEAINKVKTEEVNEKLKKLLLKEQRRLNCKLHSQNHIGQQEESQKENKDYYEGHGLKEQTITNLPLF